MSIATLKKLLMNKESLENISLIEKICHEESKKTNNFDWIGNIVTPDTGKCTIGNDVFPDIELFHSYNTEDNSNAIIHNINFTTLQGSFPFLKALLSNPICDAKMLRKRQIILKNFPKVKKVQDTLDHLKDLENDFLWIFEQRPEQLQILYDMVYFSNVLLKPLNNFDKALTGYNMYRIAISPMIGILSPIVYFLFSYCVLRIKLNLTINFIDYIKITYKSFFPGSEALGYPKIAYISMAFSLIFYFQGIFNSVEVARAAYKIVKFITQKMDNVFEFITNAEDLFEMAWVPEIDTSLFSNEKTYKCKHEFVSIKTKLTKFNLLTNFGRQLSYYKHFDREYYLPLLRKIYIIDTINSIRKLIDISKFTHVLFSKADEPCINVQGIWHPSLKEPVSNTFDIDKSMILTGPNAGGKSTLIKSLLISIIFAQTLGVTNCEHMKLTPFFYINSQINIPDCKGKESLFEAEMYRSKENLSVLRSLDGIKKKSIIFMDEIFNSTNPVEGISGAYAIAKNMSKFKSNISVFTTHFLYLTRLAKELPDKFNNMKMNVALDTETKQILSYPYKVSNGVSRQFIALELLKQNGFDQDIIDDALKIKDILLRQN